MAVCRSTGGAFFAPQWVVCRSRLTLAHFTLSAKRKLGKDLAPRLRVALSVILDRERYSQRAQRSLHLSGETTKQPPPGRERRTWGRFESENRLHVVPAGDLPRLGEPLGTRPEIDGQRLPCPGCQPHVADFLNEFAVAVEPDADLVVVGKTGLQVVGPVDPFGAACRGFQTVDDHFGVGRDVECDCASAAG